MVIKNIKGFQKTARDLLFAWFHQEFGAPKEAAWIFISWAAPLVFITPIPWLNVFPFVRARSFSLAPSITSIPFIALTVGVIARAVPAVLKLRRQGRPVTALWQSLLIVLAVAALVAFQMGTTFFLQKAGAGNFANYSSFLFEAAAFLFLLLLAASHRHAFPPIWRVIILAIAAGNISALFSFYPILTYVYNSVVPGPAYPTATLQPYLSAGPFLSVFLIVALGPLSALLVRPRRLLPRMMLGAAAGLIHGAILYAALIGPVAAILFQSPFYQMAAPGETGSGSDRLLALASAVSNALTAAFTFFFWLVLGCAVIGAVGASLTYFRRWKALHSPETGPSGPAWILPLLTFASPWLNIVSMSGIILFVLLGPSVERIFYTYSILPPSIDEFINNFSGLPGMVGWAAVSLAAVYFLGNWPHSAGGKRMAAVVALASGALELLYSPMLYSLDRRYYFSAAGILGILLSLLFCVELLRVGRKLWNQPAALAEENGGDQHLSEAGFFSGFLVTVVMLPGLVFGLGVTLISTSLITQVIGLQSDLSSIEELRAVIDNVLNVVPPTLFTVTFLVVLFSLLFSHTFTPWTYRFWDGATGWIDRRAAGVLNFFRTRINRWPSRARIGLWLLLFLALLLFLVWKDLVPAAALLIFLAAVRALLGRGWITRLHPAVLGAAFLIAFASAIGVFCQSIFAFLRTTNAVTALYSVFLISGAVFLAAIYRYIFSGPSASIARVGALSLLAVFAAMMNHYATERIEMYGALSVYDPIKKTITAPENELLRQAKNLTFFKDQQQNVWFKGRLGSMATLQNQEVHIFDVESDGSPDSDLGSLEAESLKRKWLESIDKKNPVIQDQQERIWAGLGNHFGLFTLRDGQSQPDFRIPGQRSTAGQSQADDPTAGPLPAPPPTQADPQCLATGFSVIDLASSQVTFTHDNNFIKPIASLENVSTAFSPDGSMILTKSGANVRVWDAQGNFLMALGDNPSVIGAANFSPDGHYALTLAGAQVQVWDLQKKALARSFVSQLGYLNNAIFWNNGASVLTTAGRKNNIEIWDIASGAHSLLPQVNDKDITNVGFLDDWLYVIDAKEGFLLFHQNEQPAASFIINLFTDKSDARLAGISRDGKHLLFTSRDQLALLDDKGSPLTSARKPDNYVSDTQYRLSPDGNYILGFTNEGSIYVLDSQFKEVQKISRPASSPAPASAPVPAPMYFDSATSQKIALSPTTGQIAILYNDNPDISLYAEGGKLVEKRSSGMDQLGAISFSPDGNKIAAFGCLKSNHYETFEPREDITSLAAGPDGALWISTAGDGVYQIDTQAPIEESRWQNFSAANSGLASNNASLVLAGRQGTVWFGTDAGLSRFDGTGITTVNITGLGSKAAIKALYEDAKGSIWVGTEGRAARWDGQQWTVFNESNGWQAGATASVFIEDAQKNLWAGTSQGAYRFDGQDWQNLIPNMRAIHAMVETPGYLWVGGEDGLVRYNLLTGNQDIFNTANSPALHSNRVVDLVVDSEGRLWISAFHFTVQQQSPFLPVLIFAAFLLFGLVYFKTYKGWQSDAQIRTRKMAKQLARQPSGALARLYQLLESDPSAAVLLQRLAAEPAGRLPESLRRCIESIGQMAAGAGMPDIAALDQFQAVLEVMAGQDTAAPALARLYQVLSQAASAGSPQRIASWSSVRLMKDSASTQVMLAGEQFEFVALPEFIQGDAVETLENMVQAARMVNKSERVDASSDRIGYLVGAMSAVESAARCAGRANLPERAVLGQVTGLWREVIRAELNQLSSRAELKIEFLTLQARREAEVTIAVRVRNIGEALAENVCITLQPGEGFRILNGGAVLLERLSSKDYRPVEFLIQPDAVPQMHLEVTAGWDDRESAGKTSAFPTSIQLYEVEQAFRPIPNPYSAGRPVKSARMFHGREDVFTFIMENFSATAEAHTLVLHGQRRTGKTSILYQLINGRLGERFIPVLVDMQEVGLEAKDNASLFYEIALRMVEQASRRGIEAAEPPREAFERSVTQTFNRFLDALEEQLGQRKIVLMLDEFELLEDKITSGKLDVELLGYIRSLIQKRDSLVFIFVGTHRLEEMSHDYWSILFNIALYREISFLKPEEARRLICEPVAGSLDIDVLAVEKIIALTHCHPYFTQLVCLELVNYCNRCQRNYATINDVNEVTDQILSHGEAHFAYIWQQANSEERSALAAIGQLIRPGKEWAEPGEIAHLLAANNYAVADQAALIKVLDRLAMAGILMSSKEGSLHYRFQVDLLRLWISRNQSVRGLVEREK